jgi:hypothetical protein
MSTPEIKTELTPPNLFERIAGMRFAYTTSVKLLGVVRQERLLTKLRRCSGNLKKPVRG